MELLTEIAGKVKLRSLSDECKEGKCHLSLEGLDPTQYILIAMDGPDSPAEQTATRCDFIFFGQIPDSDDFWASPIELTSSKNKSSTRVIEQLQAGGVLADELVPSDQDVSFAPIAVGPFGKFIRREFRRDESRICFRDDRIFPTAVSCHSALLDALVASRGG